MRYDTDSDKEVNDSWYPATLYNSESENDNENIRPAHPRIIESNTHSSSLYAVTANNVPVNHNRSKQRTSAHTKSPQNFQTNRDASSKTTTSPRHKSFREQLNVKIPGQHQTHCARGQWSTQTTTLETVWHYQSLQIHLDCISKMSMVYPSPRWEHGRQHAWIYKIWRLTWVC